MRFPIAASRRRPAVHTETLLACTAVFILLGGNGPFWRAALANRPWAEPATWLFAGAIFVSLASVYFALAALLSTRAEFTPVTAHQVNVEGTLNLLEFAQHEAESHGRPVVFMYPSWIAA